VQETWRFSTHNKPNDHLFKPNGVVVLEPFLRQLSGKPAWSIPKQGIERNAALRQIGPANLAPPTFLPHGSIPHRSAVNPLTMVSVAISGAGIFAKEGEITNRFIPTH